MSIAISDALQQAEHAIEGGDYQSAIQTCKQLVKQFPDYASAYGVLGEAYLEQGQMADAEQAFAQALSRNPRQARAYHGLGLIAERQEVLDNALAFCQVAWELAPDLPSLREPVIRIATRRFGENGQAQLTSAALAQIYSNTFRLQRAATEYRDALNDLPERVDLKLGLAETLWQLARNDEAADLCRQVLEENPVAIQALIILADIEGRAGQSTEAADLRARIRAIDPDGTLTAMMVTRNEWAQRESLLLPSEDMPVLDHTAQAVVAERPHIAPAPDFSYQPAHTEQPVQDIEDLEPISAEEFGTTADAVPADEMAADTAAFTGFDPGQSFPEDVPSIYRTQDDEVLSDVQQELSTSEPLSTVGDSSSDVDLDTLLTEFGDVEPMGIEEFGASPEDLERLAAREQDVLENTDDDMFGGFVTQGESESDTNEHVRSLASALEADVAGALTRTGELKTIKSESEPEPLPDAETEVEAAPREADDSLSGSGYTSVLRELGDEGFTPFNPLGRAEMQDSPAQAHFAGDESAGQDAENELAKLTEDWDSIDDEITRAMPITTGHTDELRAADDLGIAPFDFELEDDTQGPFDEHDETIEVESRVDAESADHVTEQLSSTHPEPEAVSSPDSRDEESDLLDNLEPFSLDEFESDDSRNQPFSFGSLPWESGNTGSAVPSDDDLDRLLSPQEEQPTQPVEETAPPASGSDWPTRVLGSTPAAQAEPPDWITAIQDDVRSNDQPEPDVEAAPEQPFGTWEVPSDWDSSFAVTREIGDDQGHVEELLAESEAATQAESAQDEVLDTGMSSTDILGVSDPQKMVEDESLFDRTRLAKTDLVSQEVIRGDLDLGGGASETDVAAEPETEPALDEHAEEMPAQDTDVVSTGASRNVDTLRAALEAAPEDDELHWWLAETLRERGDIAEAYGEYRWLIRHAEHRSDDVVNVLNECIENEQHAEMGHRLLADIYRRRGAVSLASSHAATAMAVRRRLRG
jgi:cytochrome c-type biogenesis protein CcmH/NrfG